MINILRKDYMLILANKMEIITFLLAMPIIITFSYLSEYLVFVIILAIVYLMSTIGFYNSKQDDILIYSLPLKNFDFILSKYIFLLLNDLVVISYIFGITWILVKLDLINNIQYLNINFMKLLIFYSIIGFSIMMPLVYSLKSNIGIRVMSVLFVLMINYSNSLFREGDRYNPAKDWVGLVNRSDFIVGVILLMIVSIIVSLYVYKKKEF